MLSKLTSMFRKNTPEKQEEPIYSNVIDAYALFCAMQANINAWRGLNEGLKLRAINTEESHAEADRIGEVIGYHSDLAKEYLNAIDPRLEVFKEILEEAFRRYASYNKSATVLHFPTKTKEEPEQKTAYI